MALDIWTDKHRPQTLDEYVWHDQQMREKAEEWLKAGGLPHALFSGLPGSGKTSLALLLLKLLDIPDEDLLKINASRERKIEDLQDKIINFIGSWAFNPSGLKYVFLDEADKLSGHVQGLLRNEMETYSSSCRFILTCNERHRIVPAIRSRVQELRFSTLNHDEFVIRAADILNEENVTFEPEVLMAHCDKTYPDLRKCIGLLQQRTVNGILNPPKKDDDATLDYLLESVALFRKNKFIEARKLIIEKASPDDYEAIYRWLYQNLDLFGSDQNQQDEALLAIRKAIVYDPQISDRELNLAACLVELTRIE